ncbi:MAG TPA: hypothetical protein DE042_07430 [Colwellia sp.]|nr:hypothetical protein [Colwellia sp.]
MLFNRYENRIIKPTKVSLLKSIKDSNPNKIFVIEPVDKINIKYELDKLVRNGYEVSMKYK